MKIAVVSIFISALVSGSLAAGISSYLNQKHINNQLKLDVLSRLVGNRSAMVGLNVDGTKEPFIALNEIFVVYADHPKVISALRKMHEELDIEGRDPDNLVSLIKAMSESLNLPIDQLNDEFFLQPFSP